LDPPFPFFGGKTGWGVKIGWLGGINRSMGGKWDEPASVYEKSMNTVKRKAE